MSSYSTVFKVVLVFTNFDIVHMFLPLDLILILILLATFDRLTSYCTTLDVWVSLYLGYSANEGLDFILV